MRSLCISIGCFALFLALCLIFSEAHAVAQGKPAQADKGISKAFQLVPAQAQEKLLMAAQKGQHKGQSSQKGGKGQAQQKGKGKGKS